MASHKPIKAERLRRLPPYLFAEIDRKKKAAIAAGRDVINLGVGDPDRPTPAVIVKSLQKHAEHAPFHQYALDQGAPEFRRAVAQFMQRRYAVAVDPDSEILGLIGSKEGIAHFPLAVLNPGDVALVPEPGYPVYRSASWFAGAETHALPLTAENGFLPDLDAVPKNVWPKARLIYTNYPNNPTAASAPREFYERLVALAHEHGFVIAQDAAYAEMYYEQPPISILQIDGAREVSIEFHSFSKTFNMTGWRVGWAAGSKDLVAALGQLKSNCDSGIFTAIQFAGITALEHYDDLVPGIRDVYRERRDVFVGGLRKLGWDVTLPAATFYVWIRCPKPYTSTELCTRLLEGADIVTTPGVGFGAAAEGYIRAALTVEVARLHEAITRIARLQV